jgi:hypothetical protein
VGDAKSSLGDATSSLGDAKSSLGDAKSSLGDAKSSLGDANKRRARFFDPADSTAASLKAAAVRGGRWSGRGAVRDAAELPPLLAVTGITAPGGAAQRGRLGFRRS